MTNIELLHEISATFINICINLMQIFSKYARKLCKIAFLVTVAVDCPPVSKRVNPTTVVIWNYLLIIN